MLKKIIDVDKYAVDPNHPFTPPLLNFIIGNRTTFIDSALKAAHLDKVEAEDQKKKLAAIVAAKGLNEVQAAAEAKTLSEDAIPVLNVIKAGITIDNFLQSKTANWQRKTGIDLRSWPTIAVSAFNKAIGHDYTKTKEYKRQQRRPTPY